VWDFATSSGRKKQWDNKCQDGLLVAAAVIVDDGRVLLVRRRVEEGRLSWQFPAGKVEPGESGAEAAVRETLEEAGLAVRVVGRLGERVSS
jgi:8-oxo-dGTP diphosphatase